MKNQEGDSIPVKVDSLQMTSSFPEWVRDANIYEVNLRQYTPEGNFNAFKEHLPRLKELGVDILWLMPVFPVGELNRKGTLGSYYSVKDYLSLNPEFGTAEEFRNLVEAIHEMGMYVILDWVANHSSWDNQLINDHPDWYTKDSLGNVVTPVQDWSDVADFNYDIPEMRQYMADALKYWIREYNVDGFRCDVASMVPLDFWETVRPQLNEIKPVFMLAESEDPEYLKSAFDMDYGWDLHHIMNDIAKGKKTATDLVNLYTNPDKIYSPDDIKMNFITNHDENSWNGTIQERLGDAAYVMAVLSSIVTGMPLLYSGQEAGLDKSLKFFDKDEIVWKEHEMYNLYKILFNLKKNNPALWNGIYGGSMKILNTSEPESVFAFIREKEDDKVFVVLNLSDKPRKFTFDEKCYCDKYKDIFTGNRFEIADEIGMELGPWQYSVCATY